MKNKMIPFLILMLCALAWGDFALAQDADSPDGEESTVMPEKFGKYEDFVVKGYSIAFSGGSLNAFNNMEGLAVGINPPPRFTYKYRAGQHALDCVRIHFRIRLKELLLNVLKTFSIVYKVYNRL